jgi:hypothetical protein
MFQKIIFLIIIIGSPCSSQAQDTLQLLNGKKKIVKIIHETPSFVVYQKIKDKDTTKLGKEKSYDKADIFRISYLFPNGNDSIQKITQVYKVDSMMGDYFTVQEMEMFLHGESQSRKNYKCFKYALGGVGVGLGSGFFGSFWGWVPVAGYTAVAGIWTIKPFLKADDPALFDNLHFTAGYKENSRKKQALYAAIGSITGFVASVFLFDLVINK